MQLKDKKIIITGGGHGIAAASVRAYVREGATVASMDINDELGRAVVDEANAKGPGKATYYHCDVSKRQEVFDVFAKAIADMGGVDVMADVAGIAAPCLAEDISEDQLDRIIAVNLKGTIFTNQAVFKAMKESGGGAIINYTSGAALIVTPWVADYGAAKAGIVGWTRQVAGVWGEYNIRVNAVAPNADTHPTPPGLEAEAERLNALVPLQHRRGHPDDDLAPVMVFLASDAARYITGQVIPVDGGAAMVR
jgi:NAD(P)-dependent dehydrogenase (short-subunit alcohol dehydrogenase family)